MAKTATITLTSAGGSNNTFSLYSNVDNYTTPFETGISKTNMLAGYTTNLIPDNATVIRCKKEGCLTPLDLQLPCYTCDNCTSPFDIFFDAMLSASSSSSLSWAEIIDSILDDGIVSEPNSNICCPDCGDIYTIASVETWLKYAEAFGLTQSGAIPA